MGLIISVALAIILANLLLTSIRVFLKILGIAVLSLIILISNNSTPVPSLHIPTEPDSWSASRPAVIERLSPQPSSTGTVVDYSSLTDQIRNGPAIEFVADGVRGRVEDVIESPNHSVRVYVGLTATTEADLSAWNSRRVAGLLQSNFCGPNGLLYRFSIPYERATLTAWGLSLDQMNEGPALLCEQARYSPGVLAD